MSDISPNFRWNVKDMTIVEQLLRLEGTPDAIKHFALVCDRLTDYSYWFLLSTLWVSYSGNSDIDLWKQLFSSQRPGRLKSIMKPSELSRYKELPYFVTAYRAHRPEEKDWIAYTLNPVTAAKFARERGVDKVSIYSIKKRDIVGLFLRRGESEILMINKDNARFQGELQVKLDFTNLFFPEANKRLVMVNNEPNS